jgi:hypothetical protein
MDLCAFANSIPDIRAISLIVSKRSTTNSSGMASDNAGDKDMSVRRQTQNITRAPNNLQLRDTILASESIHHIVSTFCFLEDAKNWPSWGNAVLLQWIEQRSLKTILAEVDDPSEEHKFVSRHIEGMHIIAFLRATPSSG